MSSRALGASVVAAALLIAGCDAPLACRDPYSVQTAESSGPSGTMTFRRQGDNVSRRLRASVRGVPELWAGDEPIFMDRLSIRLELAYEHPPGGSEPVQMPRFRMTASIGGTVQTPSLSAQPSQEHALGVGLLSSCVSAGRWRSCCPPGSEVCTVDTDVRIERLDWEPYPAVSARWETHWQVSVSDCPIPGPAPTATLEEVVP